jgi:hypothetical protein
VLTRRWRAALAMALTGALVCAATLPAVGWHAWEDWLAVGRQGADFYARCEVWVKLSRDAFNVPRRWLLTFADGAAPADDPRQPLATALGWSLWGAVAGATVLVSLLRPRAARAADGPGAAFVLLGAWQACYHFIYYDVLLAALPVCLLFTDPRRYLRPSFLGRAGQASGDGWAAYYRPAPSVRLPLPAALAQAARAGWVWNPAPPTLVALLITLPALAAGVNQWNGDYSFFFPPYDTFCLLALWAWCGLQCWRNLAPPEAEGPEEFR